MLKANNTNFYLRPNQEKRNCKSLEKLQQP